MVEKQAPVAIDATDDEIDLGELLDILLDGKWLATILMLVVTGLGVMYAHLATPIFKVDALAQIEDQGGNLGAMFGEMGDMLEAPNSASGEIELIKSRLVLGRTVQDLKLYLDVRVKSWPIIGAGLARWNERKFVTPRQAWMPGVDSSEGQYLRVTRFEVPDGYLNQAFIVRALNTEEADYALLSPMGSVLARGRAGEVLDLSELGIRLLVSELTAEPGREYLVRRLDLLTAVNHLNARLNVSVKGRPDSGIIALALEATNRYEAQQVLNSIANNYLRQNVERKGEEAEQTLSYLKEQLPALRDKLNLAEAEFNLYRTSQGSADLMQETEIILQQSAKLESLRLELDQQRKQLLQRFQSSHPTVRALDSQVADVEANRKKLEGKIKNLPETQQELLRLTRDVKVNTELYTSLLNSAQQLEVAKAGTVGTVRIIDYAQLPTDPIKPKKPLMVALSMVLGGILGVVAVFLQRMLLGTIDDPMVIEQQFGLPVYASVPLSKVQSGISNLMKKHVSGLHTLQRAANADIALEAIKSLRTSLHFALHDAPNNILLVTGPRPEVGKTFITTNLADVFSSAGKSVVVVDCDMRRGTVHNYIGQKRKPGLADFLVQSAGVDDIVKVQRNGALNFICTGTIPPNPSELLSTVAFEELITHLSERFDIVILDSPPNLAVADANILAQRAGSTILVLAAGVHPVREIHESIKRLKMVGANLKGAVLNKTNHHARRYGYGRYNYYYAYGQNAAPEK